MGDFGVYFSKMGREKKEKNNKEEKLVDGREDKEDWGRGRE